MKLYFDCTSGISGDMVRNALQELGGNTAAAELLKLPHEHEHGETYHSHRSYREICNIIEESQLSRQIKDMSCSIYQVIARAEAKVHGSDLEHIHFHEVGRNEAIRNIVGIAAALEDLKIRQIFCSGIHDGKGFIQCSHGRIPVPVPAVMAMRETCDYPFVTEDVETEMVTPSGLGILIGIGAEYTQEIPSGTVRKTVTVKGGRDTGREGLKVSLIEEGE